MPNRWLWLLAPAHLVLVLGSCYVDPDRYVREQAELLCELESECDADEDDGWWDFGVDLMNGERCGDARERELDRCAMSCDYDDDAARECIQELKAAKRAEQCGLNDDVLGACARVFTSCETDADEEPLQCEVEPPRFVAEQSSCSVTGDTGGSGAWAILLVILGAGRRNRVERRR